MMRLVSRVGVRVVRLKIWSIFSLAFSCAAMLALAAETVMARPAICSSLERQLANAGSSGGSNFARYARAAAAQGEQIQVARSQARRAGCGGGFFSIFGIDDPQPRGCNRIMNTISRMEANRAALLRKRDSLSGGGGSRRAILASLAANGCSGAKIINVKANRNLPDPIENDREVRTSLFDRLTDEDPVRKTRKEEPKEKKIIQRVKADDRRDDTASSRDSNSVYVPGGTVRTLCVRTCDGFYFPVSFSTTKDRFSKDAATCQSMCPGAEAKLYYHSIPDEEPEQMVDLAGTKYMSTPTAFQYRVNGARSTPGCSCQAAQEEPQSKPLDAEAAAPVIDKKDKRFKQWIALPQERPDRLIDPETMANLRGGLTTETLGGLLGTPDGTAATASLEPGRVRVVGPEFLPSRTGASALRAPAQTNVQ
jgi:Protein of unknown function (DUF2865)